MKAVSFPVSPDVPVNMTNDSLKLNKRNYIRVPAIEKKNALGYNLKQCGAFNLL